jgi:hypothetical protein
MITEDRDKRTRRDVVLAKLGFDPQRVELSALPRRFGNHRAVLSIDPMQVFLHYVCIEPGWICRL